MKNCYSFIKTATANNQQDTISRRETLQILGGTAVPVTVAGCLGDDEDQETDESTPEQEDETQETAPEEEEATQEEQDQVEEPPYEDILEPEFAEEHREIVSSKDSYSVYVQSRTGGMEGTFLEGEIKTDETNGEIFADLDFAPEGDNLRSPGVNIEIYSNEEETLVRLNDGSIRYMFPDCPEEQNYSFVCSLSQIDDLRELGLDEAVHPFKDLEGFLDKTAHAFREEGSPDYINDFFDLDAETFNYRQDVVDLVDGEFGDHLRDIGAYNFESHVTVDKEEGHINSFGLEYNGENAYIHRHMGAIDDSGTLDDLEPEWAPAAREAR